MLDALMVCRNCGKPIEESGGLLYPFTHVDAEQTDCFVAEPEEVTKSI